MIYGGIDMNKSDKYYLKRGKLELSMLDDEEHTCVVDSIEKKESKDLLLNFEMDRIERVKKVSKKSQQKSQQTLKINKDIYNTLHTMGQFLTNKEQQVPNRSVKKSIKIVKGQKLEQMASSLKVQDIAISPVVTKEDLSTSLPISEADQIKKTNEIVNMPIVDVNQIKGSVIEKEESLSDTRRIDTAQLEKMAINLEYRRPEVDKQLIEEKAVKAQKKINKVLYGDQEIEAQIESAYNEANQFMMTYQEVVATEENPNIKKIDLDDYPNSLGHPLAQGSILNQGYIDSILATFFKPVEPQDAFSRELKKHIEKHIITIKNYDNIL